MSPESVSPAGEHMSGGQFHDRVADEAPALRRYARSLTRDATAADDLVQDTIVLALQGEHSFRRESGLRGWLLSILHNRFISDRRQRQAEQLRRVRAAEGVDPFYKAPQEDVVRLAWLDQAIRALPEEQRAVLCLVAIDGVSYATASEALGVPLGTIMSRLSRARATLREAEQRPANCATGHLHLVGGENEREHRPDR